MSVNHFYFSFFSSVNNIKCNRNPLYLVVIFVVYLLSKALWIQMDVGRAFQSGTVSNKLNTSWFSLYKFLSCNTC